MSEPTSQNDIDALLEQVQAGNAALAGDVQAVQDATNVANQLAAEVESAASAHTPLPPLTESPKSGLSPANALAAAMGAATFSPEVQKLLAIEVPVIVQLGIRRMSVGEVMRFSVGAIIEFQKAADEELELLANNIGIGSGNAVKVGENFGIKITQIGSVKETIRKLGGANQLPPALYITTQHEIPR